eukprot:gnl/TRDRNA2_/TRDRNA2_138300_c0_seq1.p2 gnl/TRDRNA2_/TRDRNA2_138300_c0~~gnl/TRDRNA2_/TRDRNA2_138300_c0_seq1.p2  ORF type:complete len:100 (+),score=15.76 gnl/TRDRNA2_/TRDRNA2_138300_c0_seq1:50-349(+)
MRHDSGTIFLYVARNMQSSEAALVRPINVYTLSKQAVDILQRALLDDEMKLLILRRGLDPWLRHLPYIDSSSSDSRDECSQEDADTSNHALERYQESPG